MPYSVAVVVGSLRKESLSRKLALALATLAPESLKLAIVEIGALPLYDQDAEADPPAPWLAFRQAVRAADAVLFVTPEYNRSIPGGLKNAVDVGSRPPGHSVWNAKPGAVVSNSPGALGGFGASQHLRQSLTSVNVAILPSPEVYVSGVANLFGETGAITRPDTETFLRGFMGAFAVWVERCLRP